VVSERTARLGMKNRGLLYVAFGNSYQELAVWTITHTRKFTDLPIAVLVNEPANSKWEGMDNVIIYPFELPQTENRQVKTQMCRYTPFDETLYMDCDSVVRCSGIEMLFSMMSSQDMLLNKFIHWRDVDKVPRLYRTAMKLLGASLPMNVYNGALIGWRNNNRTERFFKLWNSNWHKIGKGREMPGLACAIQKSELEVADVSDKGIFEPDFYNPDCMIQHNYNSNGKQDWFEEFKLPKLIQCKPFDSNPRDWDMVDFNEEMHS